MNYNYKLLSFCEFFLTICILLVYLISIRTSKKGGKEGGLSKGNAKNETKEEKETLDKKSESSGW